MFYTCKNELINKTINAMKKNLLFIILLLAISHLMMAENKPVISFEKQEYNLGSIKFTSKSKKIRFNYAFKNTGNAPLIINSVQTSCGCTISEWTKNPVPSGAKGHVYAILELKGTIGVIRKTLFVYSNASKQVTQLYIKGLIK
jgi:hypothetical protein